MGDSGLTADEDAKRIARMNDINDRYEHSVIDARTGKRVYVPKEVVEQEKKRFVEEMPEK